MSSLNHFRVTVELDMGSTIEYNVNDLYTYYDIEAVKKAQYDLAKNEYGPLVKAVEVERMQGE